MECKQQQVLGHYWEALPRDAHIVSLLHRVGAVILGHANMSEWSSVRSSVYSTGYSPRGGQVRNPYDLSSSPCEYGDMDRRPLLLIRFKLALALALLLLYPLTLCLYHLVLRQTPRSLVLLR